MSRFSVKKSRRHDLVIPTLKSRLATAVIFGFQGLAKEVIVTLILLGNSSRAFIITQEGLRGFLNTTYSHSDSWLFEFQTSLKFREQMTRNIEPL